MGAPRGRRVKKPEGGVRKTGPGGPRQDGAEKIEIRADYVIQVIRDQPWLDGRYLKLAAVVRDRFKVGRNASERVVTRAYELLAEERKKRMPGMVDYLDRVHHKTIEIGLKTQDGRVITPAAAELRKLHGIGEPDQIKLSGEVGGGVSLDDVAMLAALKLTNAQRQAEIDALSAELGEDIKQTSEARSKTTEQTEMVGPVPPEPVADEPVAAPDEDEDDE